MGSSARQKSTKKGVQMRAKQRIEIESGQFEQELAAHPEISEFP